MEEDTLDDRSAFGTIPQQKQAILQAKPQSINELPIRPEHRVRQWTLDVVTLLAKFLEYYNQCLQTGGNKIIFNDTNINKFA